MTPKELVRDLRNRRLLPQLLISKGNELKDPTPLMVELMTNFKREVEAAMKERCAKLVDSLFQEPRVVAWDEYGKAIRALE